MNPRHTLRAARKTQTGDKVANRRKSAEWTYEYRPCTPTAARAGWLRRLAKLKADHLEAAATSVMSWYEFVDGRASR